MSSPGSGGRSSGLAAAAIGTALAGAGACGFLASRGCIHLDLKWGVPSIRSAR